MTSLISDNLLIIVIAVLIGAIVGWWLLRKPAGTAAHKAAHDPLADLPHEGHSLADEDVAAVADIAGEFLGVNVHSELPGAGGPPDNLQVLKGVGAKMATKLNENGICRYDQLASLTPAQIAALDARMEPFQGRIERDRLVDQAGYLARGDLDGFQATFGNLGGDAA
jgi:predicted flap endonuclease-1-like 5' DNA nuclease